MNSKRVTEIGLVLGALGAALIALGAFTMLMAARGYDRDDGHLRRREKILYLSGGILMALGFALQLAATISKKTPTV